ncbi:hypothetical protein GCM10009850_063860 [Nonomuraea monospora]|uniref:Uncharacterized protein n=1 Tax=Nonomuraea monospora TaxID=568818 RepID=A0ABN3CNE9_9ACTN
MAANAMWDGSPRLWTSALTPTLATPTPEHPEVSPARDLNGTPRAGPDACLLVRGWRPEARDHPDWEAVWG